MRPVLVLMGLVGCSVQFEEQCEQKSGDVQVVVADRPIDAGTVVTADDVRPIPMPPDYVPNAVLRTSDDVIGRQTTGSILEGEYFRAERFSEDLAEHLHIVPLPDVPSLAPWAISGDPVAVILDRDDGWCSVGIAHVVIDPSVTGLSTGKKKLDHFATWVGSGHAIRLLALPPLTYSKTPIDPTGLAACEEPT